MCARRITAPKKSQDQKSGALVAQPKLRVFEGIIEFITGQIDAGVLSPGDCLKPERELAPQLGVSRGSLREALKTLEMLDVVELRHGVGVFIKLPQPQVLTRMFGTLLAMQPGQSEDIMDARIALELYAVRLACKNGGARDFARMGKAVSDMKRETAGGKVERGAAADYEFHNAMIESTGNATLMFLYNAIAGLLKKSHHERRLMMFKVEGGATALNEVHQAILDAISARDEDRAAELMMEHFRIIETFQQRRLSETKGRAQKLKAAR